jgi:hypothetical protein
MVFGLFGSTSSKSNVNIENVNEVFNTLRVDVLNEKMSNKVSEVTIENSKSCKSEQSSENTIKTGKIKAKKGIKIGNISQKQETVVDLSCVDKTKIMIQSQDKIIDEFMNEINSSTQQNLWAEAEAVAESKAKDSSFLGLGKVSSESNINQKNKNVSKNENFKNLRNIIKNTVEEKFNVKNVNDCLASVANKNTLDTGDLESEDGAVEITNISQEQVSSGIAKCVSETDLATQIIKETASKLGFKTKDEVKQTSGASAKAKAVSSAEKTSPLGDLAALMGGSWKILLALAVLGAIGFGIYYYITNRKSSPDAGITMAQDSQVQTQTTMDPHMGGPIGAPHMGGPLIIPQTMPCQQYSMQQQMMQQQMVQQMMQYLFQMMLQQMSHQRV